MSHSGLLFVVSAPSGGGKTTLCRRLLDEFPQIHLSVSYTTRSSRGPERAGIDYNYVDPATFEAMVAAGAFAEWAEVHGHRYGTSKQAVLEATHRGRDVLFDIDYQGGRQLKAQFSDAVMIYILPPSMAVLEARLRGRGTDDPATIERRLAKAETELAYYHLYDYLIINEEIEAAYEALRAIYRAAHFSRERQAYHVEALLRR
jgi:guanylate kinase